MSSSLLEPVALLVWHHKERAHLTLPFVSARRFDGDSLSRLCDDAALHLMERVFEGRQDAIDEVLYCPETSHRRVKVNVVFEDDTRFTGRLSVVLRRWPGDSVWEATLPRYGTERFAVKSTSGLPHCIAAFLKSEGGKRPESVLKRLEAARCQSHEYLDLMEVDFELPTILPGTVRAPRRLKPGEKPSAVERAKRRRQTPPHTLREVGVNLVHRSLDGNTPDVVGRDALIEHLVSRVRRAGAAVLLVGPSGVGKSALIGAVIGRLAAEDPRLSTRSDAWLVDANRIISGMSYVGQWEGRVARMVEELDARGDVLVVDDLASLVFAGRTVDEQTNVAGFLEPHIAQGEIRVLAECTPEALEAARDEAPGFFAAFHTVRVPALDETTTLRVLVSRLRAVEAAALARGPDHRVRIASDVPAAALALSRRFLARQHLPGRAVRLLEALATDPPGEQRDAFGRRVLDREALVNLFAAQTGLPRLALWEQDGKPEKEILAHFTRRVVGQPEASRAAADIVLAVQQGLNDPLKPIASMLLIGPTGVGKTETAKALAEYLFGDKNRMIRFDMAELGGPGSAARLFGDRHQPDGELTRRVRQQPFAVVLLDEIEKAHPSVFDALLALLGEGRLTSADGRTTDFCNTVILLTSNLGVRDAESIVGFEGDAPPDRRLHYKAAAREFFRPELFNRLDRIVAYRSLDRASLRPLVERVILEIISRRGLRRSGVLVEVEDALVELMIERGFDIRYGARALKRAVEQQLVVPLARRLARAPTDRVTRVALHRAGDGVGMEVWPLESPQAPPARPDWARMEHPELAARVAEIQAVIARHEARIERCRQLRSSELERFSAGELGPDELTRFETASEACRAIDAARTALENVSEVQLAPVHYEDRVEVGHEAFNYIRSRFKIETVVDTEVVRWHGGRPSRADVEAVENAWLDTAEALARADAAEGDPDQVLVRLLPATRDGESLTLADDMCRAMAMALREWGSVDEYRRGEDGRWAKRHKDSRGAPSGFALHVRGFDVRARLADELGFHLAVRYSGPDLISALCRIEDVHAQGTSPSERLETLDAEFAEFLEARRRGQAVDNPRGPLRIVRRFEGETCLDPDTGLRLSWRESGEGLPQLDRVFRHRIARALAEEAGEP